MTSAESYVEVVKGLEHTNFLKVHGVCHQIHVELNFTTKDVVMLDLYKTFPDIWNAEGVTSINVTQTKAEKERVLSYLRELGVIEITARLTTDVRLKVDRTKFYELYEALKKRRYPVPVETAAPTPTLKTPVSNGKKLVDKLPVYWVGFKEGIITINGIYLSKPQFGSINYDFFNEVWENPNKRLDVQEMFAKFNHDTKKTVHHILSDLGFKDEAKTLFFPKAGSRYLEFRKMVFADDLHASGVDYIKFGRNR